MGCLSVKYTRVGGDISATMERVGGMTCRFSLICSTGVTIPYLEINPNVVILDDSTPVSVSVSSNTSWTIS